jgi:hypothetical protein
MERQGFIFGTRYGNAGDLIVVSSDMSLLEDYNSFDVVEMSLTDNLEYVAPIPNANSVTPPLVPDSEGEDNVNMEVDAHDQDNNSENDMEEEQVPVVRRLTRRQVQAQNRREDEARALAERREREMQEAERIAEQNLNAESAGPDDDGTLAKNRNKPKKPKLTMVIWNLDDTYLVTASADYIIRVWRSSDGILLHALKFHENNIFVLAPHPIFPDIVMSAGYDGKVCLWDIFRGVLLKSFDEVGRLFLDGQFSEDGKDSPIRPVSEVSYFARILFCCH